MEARIYADDMGPDVLHCPARAAAAAALGLGLADHMMMKPNRNPYPIAHRTMATIPLVCTSLAQASSTVYHTESVTQTEPCRIWAVRALHLLYVEVRGGRLFNGSGYDLCV